MENKGGTNLTLHILTIGYELGSTQPSSIRQRNVGVQGLPH